MEKRINPLLDKGKRESSTFEKIESAERTDKLSPVSKKEMKEVSCDGIPAYFDEENRLALPVRI